MTDTCALVLKDGTVMYGTAFGAPAPKAADLVPGKVLRKTAGEVVFNTGMSGYYEILTDPSYTGQIVTMTYPHIGNYGVDESWSESGPEVERPLMKAAGFVVKELYRGPVPKGRKTLDEAMKESGVPGIEGIDTRALTINLRDNGSPIGVIISCEEDGLSDAEKKQAIAYIDAFPSMEGTNLVVEVGTNEDLTINEDGVTYFALLDCGIKANIIREMEKRGVKIKLFTSNATAEEILASGVSGVLVSNGPGDPAVLDKQIETVKGLIGKIPLSGICLGHQLISLALGAKTYKMKFGHHGINHPVRDEKTKNVFVTSQNHGFAVDEKSLPDGVKVWFRNANDQSIEGIYHETLPICTAQFHPESAPGPHDSTWIFQEFIDLAKPANK